jgi:CRISPR-associated endonuclease Csn1
MKTLGLDLGTNSIGWAVVNARAENPLIAKGVQVFHKGVGESQKGEFSRAAERTGYRAARRIKQRRKWRKQQTLRVLVENDFCPGLTVDEIDQWRYQKKYPASPDFRDWQRVWEKDSQNQPATPYYYRWLAASKPLDLTEQKNRHRLGRAFYHLAQRRGYKSNRLSGDEKEGVVINEINANREARNGKTLGQYYYEDCQGKKPIRGQGHYTGRSDYLEEFERICEVQQLPPEFVKPLREAIFFQRPLKSQKGTVGPCMLEPKKRRAPISHPLYERFCAVQFLNNIRIRPIGERESRHLTDDERETCLGWMSTRIRVEKFEALARQITPKRSKRNFGEKPHHIDVNCWGFNYRKDAGVPASFTTGRLVKLFGPDYADELKDRYAKSKGKSSAEVLNDVWHAMYNFPDEDHLDQFAQTQLGMKGEEERALFCQPLKQGYGTLSLNAIRKILPWLEQGMIYPQAVFLANMPTLFKRNQKSWTEVEQEVVGKVADILKSHREASAMERAVNSVIKQLREEDIRDLEMHMVSGRNRREVEQRIQKSLRGSLGGRFWSEYSEQEQTGLTDQVLGWIRDRYAPKPAEIIFVSVLSLKERIGRMLIDEYGFKATATENLYHPSATEAYPAVEEKLESPRIPSIRNPVFMRTMHRLKAIVNELIEEGVIDSETVVQVEMARDLNNANDRAAIERYQRERNKQRDSYRDKIEECGYPATDTNILKYQLWVEQEERCMYTDQQISLSDFLGDNPRFDIEHTIPRSRRFDNSQTNVTLCERQFNREVKRNRIPQELEENEDILSRARKLWEPKINALEIKCAKDMAACKAATDKVTKDKRRQQLLFDRMKLRYWRGKLRNFEATEVPEGFLNSQLVDTRIISKYAVLYLKSYFDRVYSMKASALSEFRKIWGLNKKHRDDHVHHCVDAVIAASVRPSFYRDLAEYYHQYERYEFQQSQRPHPPEPWKGYATYLNDEIVKDVLVVQKYKDLLLKQSFHKVREKGNETIVQGDTVRGSLHKDTYYGKIQTPPAKGEDAPGPIVCVVRKRLDNTFKDVDKIVDPYVRECVERQKAKLKTGEPIWFDEERKVPIKKVRVYFGVKPDSMIELKEHRDTSGKGYNQSLFAENADGGNYLIAIYRCSNGGKQRAGWRKLSNMKAVEVWKNKRWEKELPAIDDKGLKKISILKSHTQVLLCKDKDEDLRQMSMREIVQRLYTVTALEGPTIQLRQNTTAKQKKKLGPGKAIIPWDSPSLPEKLRLATNKMHVLVEGQHFNISETGVISWLE